MKREVLCFYIVLWRRHDVNNHLHFLFGREHRADVDESLGEGSLIQSQSHSRRTTLSLKHLHCDTMQQKELWETEELLQ